MVELSKLIALLRPESANRGRNASPSDGSAKNPHVDCARTFNSQPVAVLKASWGSFPYDTLFSYVAE